MAISTRRVSREAGHSGAVAAVAMSALLLAGCGGSSASDAATTTTAPRPTGASSTPAITATTTSGSASGETKATTADVSIKDFQFKSDTLRISTGTKVTWTNNDKETHTATADSGTPMDFDTGDVKPGASASVTFTKPGTYKYHCNFHATMTGTITVS